MPLAAAVARTSRAVAGRVAARGKDHVPDALWPLLLTVRSLPGDAPVVGLPAYDRVVALAAHPDDESVGCAGTLALLTDRGARATVVFVSDGEATRGATTDRAETGRRRRDEGARAAALLGASARFLGHPDGDLPAVVDLLADQLAGILDELDPQLLLLPWFLDGHPDHRALSDALARVPRLPEDLQVWGYETWSALPPNRLVDVTEVGDRKRASLATHATALATFDVTAGLGLGRWRSMHGLMGRGEAEAFLALPADRYCTLTLEARR